MKIRNLKMTEKRKAYKKAYRAAHKDKIRENSKAYYQEHKDEFKKHYEDNKAERKEYSKKYYEDNKAERKKYSKKYYEDNKTEVLAYNKKYKKFYQKQKYCCEDISQIENYSLAKADNFIKWDIHHRLETNNSDGERRLVDLTRDELKALDMYYNRPASELIFIKHGEHTSLHSKGKKNENKKDKLQTVEQTSIG